MKFSKSEPGMAISAAIHFGVLALTLVVFSDSPKFDDAQESVPVETISESQFNQIMKGEKTAKEVKPLQRADKVAEQIETKPTPPVAEAKRDVPTPPSPLKRLPDPGEDDKPDPPTPPQKVAVTPPPAPAPPPRPEPVTAPKPPVEAEKDDPQSDAAETVKPPPRPKTPEKPQAKPAPEKPKTNAVDEAAKVLALLKARDQKKSAEKSDKPANQPKSGQELNDKSLKASLAEASRFLSKEAAQSKASTGRELSHVASLGAPNASAAKMSPTLGAEFDNFLKETYHRCWEVPVAEQRPNYEPIVRIELRKDGSLGANPVLTNPAYDPTSQALADSAMRAVRKCNPLNIPAKFLSFYDEWQVVNVKLNPNE